MRGTIVCVDDEAPVLRALRRDLSPWLERSNLNLLTVGSAAACLDYLQNTSEDVVMVITDLRMPGMNGGELIELLARRYSDIGLVLLTAYTDIEAITRAVTARICGLIFKPWEVERLTTELGRIVLKVESMRRHNRHHYEMVSQLRIAGDFQHRFLLARVPTADRYTIEVSNHPAPGIYVTGDYYDTIVLDEDRILLLLGDVSGHGVKSAFIAMMLKVIIEEHRDNLTSPAFRLDSFLTYVNRALIQFLNDVDEVLVSFSAVLVDLAAEKVIYGGGGNPPLCLIRKRSVERLSTGSPALGASVDLSYTTEEIPLRSGDRLVLYTDGLYDRGVKRTIAWYVLAAIFVQANEFPSFVKQVERLLGAMDILNEPLGADAHRDDLTVVTMKIHDLHIRN